MNDQRGLKDSTLRFFIFLLNNPKWINFPHQNNDTKAMFALEGGAVGVVVLLLRPVSARRPLFYIYTFTSQHLE